MTNGTNSSENSRYNLVFLFPGVYRPLKVNFAREFELLSKASTGHIFTACSVPHRNVTIGNFHLHSARIRPSAIRTFLSRLWIHIPVPLWLLWRTSRIDAVITWDPYASGLAGLILKVLFRTKLIVEVVGDYHKMDPTEDVVGDPGQQNRLVKSLKKWGMRLVLHLAVQGADAIKVVNTDLEEFFRSHYPRKPIYRFPCFVANSYFQSLECSQGDYLLSIGYPFYRKGMDILIRAFTLLSIKHPSIRLRIMGHSSEEELKKYRQLGRDDPRIEFVKPGWIEDAGEQLRGCYALVHAARSDAAPRVLFEAMACRKPIISSRTSGGVDYVLDGKTGLLCEIGDVEGLAKAMDFLVSNPSLATQMGQTGFERLQKEFSEDMYTRSVLTMAEEVISKGNGVSRKGSKHNLRKCEARDG